MIRLLVFLVILSGSPALAFVQCAEGNPPSVDDLLKAEEAMANAKSNIARIVAFKTLLTTRDPDFLNEAIQLGLKSDNAAIKATALRCKLLNSTHFTVKVLPYEQAAAVMSDMDEKTVAIVQAAKEWKFSVTKAFEQESCVSFYKRKHKSANCYPDYAAFARELSVSLQIYQQAGRFELGDGGRLIGTFTESTYHKLPTVPAELFMD